MERRITYSTYRLLELLDKYMVKATFFVVGSIAEQNPHLIRTVHEEGHEISSHGYMHLRYSLLPSQEIRSDIDKAVNVLAMYVFKWLWTNQAGN
jgi:peptidoglycan/xylan/chitin deacetylase (PgdA/CDA1 family)